MMRALALTVALACAFSCAAAPPLQLAKEARELLSAGDVDAAISRYEAARAASPDSAELAYNLGVARFRQGKFAEAAQLFKEAAAKGAAGLAANAMFNQGTSVYADALTKVPDSGAPRTMSPQPAGPAAAPDPGAGAPADPLAEAITAVEQSVTHFRDASAANPSDSDSRANAERAWRLLKKLREEQAKQRQQQQDQQQKEDQKQDQQDQQDQQDRQDQSQDKQDQQKQDQKNDQQKQNEDGSSDEQKPDPSKRDQSSGKDEQKDQGQDREPEKQDKKGESQPKDAKQPKDGQGKPKTQQSAAPQDGDKDQKGEHDGQRAKPTKPTMSRDEAERLLQIVRDREKERRELKAKQERARQQPVQKDW